MQKTNIITACLVGLIFVAGGISAYIMYKDKNALTRPSTKIETTTLEQTQEDTFTDDTSSTNPLLETETSSSVEVEDDVTMCTMDAQQCPDGSYVGRTGKNCEFVCN